MIPIRIAFMGNVFNCSSNIIPGNINPLIILKSAMFMNINDTVLTFSIHKLPLLFKPIKERDAAICLYCRAEVLRSRAFLMESGKGWNQAQQPLCCAEVHSCARPAQDVPSDGSDDMHLEKFRNKRVFPLRNCSECVYRHHHQEQKLWASNDHRTLVEGGSAFCAVSLNRDHITFVMLYLCLAQN